MRSIIPILTLGLCLFHAESRADINDILGLQQAINNFCGVRMNVILVDESHSNPPCIMTYSDGCEEAQPNTPQSCLVVMSKDNAQAADGKVVSVSW
jgi:hypothetical protein